MHCKIGGNKLFLTIPFSVVCLIHPSPGSQDISVQLHIDWQSRP